MRRVASYKKGKNSMTTQADLQSLLWYLYKKVTAEFVSCSPETISVRTVEDALMKSYIMST